MIRNHSNEIKKKNLETWTRLCVWINISNVNIINNDGRNWTCDLLTVWYLFVYININ